MFERNPFCHSSVMVRRSSIEIVGLYSEKYKTTQDLDLWLNLNGKSMQTGNTSTMIFDVKTIVSYVSHYMTLEPGDLIATGTPPGVGAGMKPQKFLKHGDEMHLGIEKLGEQCQKVVKWK